MSTYHIVTYGCQMNRSDSERVASVLENRGLNASQFPNDADVIVVNACSVRQSAIDRIWGNIKQWEKIKQQRPLMMILTGCVLPSDKPKFEKHFDAILPIKEIASLPRILEDHGLTPRDPRSDTDEDSTRHSPATVPPQNTAPPLQDRAGMIKLTREDSGEEGGVREDRAGTLSNTADDAKELRNSPAGHSPQPSVPYNYFTNQPLTPISQNVVSNTYLNLRPRHASLYSAFVPIMTGCNAFCTYCAVPYTRGPEENRHPLEIIHEVEDLIMKKNYKEVTLLGQIVNKYNARADDALIAFLEWYQTKYSIALSFIERLKNSEKRIFTFNHLLETLGKLPKKFWLRFTSSHPNWFTDELITTIRDIPNIPKHFHLPVQAGSDSVLLRMRRPYKITRYREFIKKIRNHIPLATITTDCIVGFPGETEEEFEQTLRLFEEVRYDMAFTAQYSPRPDTYAAHYLPDDVPHEVKKMREKRLNDILQRTALENNQRLIGTTWDVLIHEKLNPKNLPPADVSGDRGAPGETREYTEVTFSRDTPSHPSSERERRTLSLYSATSENFKHVHVESRHELRRGEFVSVKITGANPWGLKGQAVD